MTEKELEMIAKTEEFLKNKFDEGVYFSTHEYDKTYRLEHTYRVANIGRKIAEEEGFNEAEMIIACLLHDVSYCEEFDDEGWRNHGRSAARIARPFLEELGLPKDRINEICYGIAIHVDAKADFEGEKTAFATSIYEADNIDRFDVYRIHETLWHDGFAEKSYEERLDYAEKRLANLRYLKNVPIGTKAAAKMWEERITFYIEFYEKLVDQLKCSKSIL